MEIAEIAGNADLQMLIEEVPDYEEDGTQMQKKKAEILEETHNEDELEKTLNDLKVQTDRLKRLAKLNKSVENKCKCENMGVYVRFIFVCFSIFWLLIIVLNDLYKSEAYYVLILPFIVFFIAFFNSNDIIDDKVETDVFSVTFVTLGILFSMPLLAFFNKDTQRKDLNHVIYLAMIFTLVSYFHFWVDENYRHYFKMIRSCFETMAITLYIYALTIYFIHSA